MAFKLIYIYIIYTYIYIYYIYYIYENIQIYTNTQILNATIEYILTTKRLDESRFHS